MGMSRVRSWALGAWALACWAVSPAPAVAQVSLYDPRFEEVRRASVEWDRRPGPTRQVVDVVCLVPDLATYLDAVATWDDRHYFPVLIDDAEYTLKFLRAFRPARVVRYPAKAAPVAPEALWDRAIAAAGLSWTPETGGDGAKPAGDAPPASLGPTPPGVVVSNPSSPSLAGAVGLAAGHAQPLLRWQPAKGFQDLLEPDDARGLALDLQRVVAAGGRAYDRLGDDCDFVTLAADSPYRYHQNGGINAVDDLLLRSPSSLRRWGYAGRLTGDPVASAYRAMAALFLHPKSALLLNTYGETDRPWTEYAMGRAATALGATLAVTHRNGGRADLAGWHEAFDPINPFGLVLVNTSGGPRDFNINGGPGMTADVPATAPAAVLMIHSYSAESPDDPGTIAGRWLANGAFVYYGSVSEPWLQGFRPPDLVAAFLAENLPVVAAARRSDKETYGHPWRLCYFGDPLYRIKPVGPARPRLAAWVPIAAWPAYGEYRRPEPTAAEAVRLNWALKTAIYQCTAAAAPPKPRGDLADVLLGVDRDRLDPGLRALRDDLVIDVLTAANRSPELIDRLNQISPGERSAAVRRRLETCQTAALQRAVASRDFPTALALWDRVIAAEAAGGFGAAFTDRVARLADNPGRLRDWRAALTAARRKAAVPAHSALIDAELKRVDAASAGPTTRAR